MAERKSNPNFKHGPAKGAGGGFEYKPPQDGWGGSPKGSGISKTRAFNSDTARDAGIKRHTPPKPGTLTRAEKKAQRSDQLEDMLFNLATAAEREETRVSAATKLHAIYNGTPIARSININSDDISNLSDDQLAAELARTGGTQAAVGAGDAAERMSSKLPGILH